MGRPADALTDFEEAARISPMHAVELKARIAALRAEVRGSK